MQLGQLLLLIFLSGCVTYLIFFREDKNLTKAVESIKAAETRIGNVQKEISKSSEKVEGVISIIESTKLSFDTLKEKRFTVVRDIRLALAANRKERVEIEKKLLTLKEELDSLRVLAEQYQP